MTVSWHVDDLKVSHLHKSVVDNFLQWVQDTYGKIGKVKINQGKKHKYLGMTLDYSVPGQVSINMIKYIKSFVYGFPAKYLDEAKVVSPWNNNLFKVNEQSKPLNKEMSELFHTVKA